MLDDDVRRLESLKLAVIVHTDQSAISRPDAGQIVETAKAFEGFITGGALRNDPALTVGKPERKTAALRKSI